MLVENALSSDRHFRSSRIDGRRSSSIRYEADPVHLPRRQRAAYFDGPRTGKCVQRRPVVRIEGSLPRCSESKRFPLRSARSAVRFWLESLVYPEFPQSDDNDVRCIVLASSLEKLFTAGLDLKCVSSPAILEEFTPDS